MHDNDLFEIYDTSDTYDFQSVFDITLLVFDKYSIIMIGRNEALEQTWLLIFTFDWTNWTNHIIITTKKKQKQNRLRNYTALTVLAHLF